MVSSLEAVQEAVVRAEDDVFANERDRARDLIPGDEFPFELAVAAIDGVERSLFIAHVDRVDADGRGRFEAWREVVGVRALDGAIRPLLLARHAIDADELAV